MDDGLYMVRFKVDLPALHEWAQSRQMRRQTGFDRGYVMHCLLTETFGKLAPKPFRLTEPRRPGGREGVLHGYTSVHETQLVEASQLFTDPLQAKILPARVNPDEGHAGRMGPRSTPGLRDTGQAGKKS